MYSSYIASLLPFWLHSSLAGAFGGWNHTPATSEVFINVRIACILYETTSMTYLAHYFS